ncbi:MAG: hypothetical protein IPJ28_01260 [Betaproteobacteria bacterium]|nr:hypothetical protein [Betaproteobacteria bacterium]
MAQWAARHLLMPKQAVPNGPKRVAQTEALHTFVLFPQDIALLDWKPDAESMVDGQLELLSHHHAFLLGHWQGRQSRVQRDNAPFVLGIAESWAVIEHRPILPIPADKPKVNS